MRTHTRALTHTPHLTASKKMLFAWYDNLVGPRCPELSLRGSQTWDSCLQQNASYLQHFAKGQGSFFPLYYLSFVSGGGLYQCNLALFRSREKSEELTIAIVPWLPVEILHPFYLGSRTHKAQSIYINSLVRAQCGWQAILGTAKKWILFQHITMTSLQSVKPWTFVCIIFSSAILEGMFQGFSGWYQDEEILCLFSMNPGCRHRGSMLAWQTEQTAPPRQTFNTKLTHTHFFV